MNDKIEGTSTPSCVGGAIAVFAKCPIAGASKTRLTPLLGAEGAASLAQAMLSDVLVSLCTCSRLDQTLKVLVYAPGTKEGELQMVSILQSLNLNHQMVGDDETTLSEKAYNCDGWLIMPMMSSSSTTKSDLRSSSLGDKLQDALERTRQLISCSMNTTSTDIKSNSPIINESVLFLGMDSPELPLEEIVHGLQTSSGSTGKAHMCPAHDGGYGLLSVPKNAPSNKIFSGVRWSNSLTAVSQLKALTDSNCSVSMGRLMYDIDEPEDVKDLAMRLIHAKTDTVKNNNANLNTSDNDILCTSSAEAITVGDSYPYHTRKALIDLNIIQVCDGISKLSEENPGTVQQK